MKQQAVHELGHFLGLKHLQGRAPSYMHETVNDCPDQEEPLPEADRQALCWLIFCGRLALANVLTRATLGAEVDDDADADPRKR